MVKNAVAVGRTGDFVALVAAVGVGGVFVGRLVLPVLLRKRTQKAAATRVLREGEVPAGVAVRARTDSVRIQTFEVAAGSFGCLVLVLAWNASFRCQC